MIEWYFVLEDLCIDSINSTNQQSTTQVQKISR